MARGYGGNAPGKTTFDKGLTWALIGAGGMVTSIDDLATWSAALKHGTIFPAGTPNSILIEANERWLLGSLAQINVNGESIVQMGGSTDYGYTALIQFVPNRDLLIVLLLNAHDDKYKNATHHRLSRNHILPKLLGDGAELPNNSIQSTANTSAD
jgi:CubicO group peptidase (beta-lactamase class C family)